MSYLSLEKKSIFNLWKVIKFLSFFIQFIKKIRYFHYSGPQIVFGFHNLERVFNFAKKKRIAYIQPIFLHISIIYIIFFKISEVPILLFPWFFSLNFWNKNNQFGRASWHLAKSVIFKNPISVMPMHYVSDDPWEWSLLVLENHLLRSYNTSYDIRMNPHVSLLRPGLSWAWARQGPKNLGSKILYILIHTNIFWVLICFGLISLFLFHWIYSFGSVIIIATLKNYIPHDSDVNST